MTKVNVQLGDEARDTVSGFAGVCVARTEWLNGCWRMTLQPKALDKDGKPQESQTFDDFQLEVTRAKLQPVGTKLYAGPAVQVTDEMVQRFLGWRLPDTFAPDCYVSFDREGIKKMGDGSHWPTGTNLLNDPEARAMLEHVLEAALTPKEPQS